MEITKNKPLILIVDDIPRNLQVLSSIIIKEGYEIALATNGKEALSTLESIKPDLILLDIMMPEMDGFEVAEIIRKDDELSQIPIIFITGKADMQDVINGFKAGAVDYITKPFNSVELISRVKTHVSLKLSRDELKLKNTELEHLTGELENTIASKDKFFSIIAHDLKGPFSGFLGLANMLEEEYKDLSREDIAQIGKNMNNAAKRLFSLLENLLHWSRTQTGGMEFNPCQIDLYDLSKKINKLFYQSAEEKQIDLINEVPKDTFVFADENMLNTILRNIISNAIKFTDKNGKIKISAHDIGDFFQICIEDNGIGIKDKDKHKIFQIHSKITTVGTNSEKGTGLGLILCKELVELHKGNINFESEQGKGTKFFFTMPKSK